MTGQDRRWSDPAPGPRASVAPATGETPASGAAARTSTPEPGPRASRGPLRVGLGVLLLVLDLGVYLGGVLFWLTLLRFGVVL